MSENPIEGLPDLPRLAVKRVCQECFDRAHDIVGVLGRRSLLPWPKHSTSGRADFYPLVSGVNLAVADGRARIRGAVSRSSSAGAALATDTRIKQPR
jgi:hypothetical protein